MAFLSRLILNDLLSFLAESPPGVCFSYGVSCTPKALAVCTSVLAASSLLPTSGVIGMELGERFWESLGLGSQSIFEPFWVGFAVVDCS
jgi:hypothetical protein